MNTLEGIDWQLVSYADAQGNTVSALAEPPATVTFASNQIAGTAGCNRFSARYELNGAALKIGPVQSTLMACPEPRMTQERVVFEDLAKVAAFELAGDGLQLKDASGNTLLTFTAVQPLSLTGRQWTMTFYNNGKGGFISAVVGSKVTATFGEDGKLSGSGGCNGYGGDYEVNGQSIKIGPVISTLMACADEAVTQQEAAFFNALNASQIYRIEGNKLMLFGADGARMVEFVAVAA